MPKAKGGGRKAKSVSVALTNSPMDKCAKKFALPRQQTPMKKLKLRGHSSVMHNKILSSRDISSDESLPDLDNNNNSDTIQPSQKANCSGPPLKTPESDSLDLHLEIDEEATWIDHMDKSITESEKVAHEMAAASVLSVWKGEEKCEECMIRDNINERIQGMSSSISHMADLVAKSLIEISHLRKMLKQDK